MQDDAFIHKGDSYIVFCGQLLKMMNRCPVYYKFPAGISVLYPDFKWFFSAFHLKILAKVKAQKTKFCSVQNPGEP